jgi:hypothetical protein
MPLNIRGNRCPAALPAGLLANGHPSPACKVPAVCYMFDSTG